MYELPPRGWPRIQPAHAGRERALPGARAPPAGRRHVRRRAGRLRPTAPVHVTAAPMVRLVGMSGFARLGARPGEPQPRGRGARSLSWPRAVPLAAAEDGHRDLDQDLTLSGAGHSPARPRIAPPLRHESSGPATTYRACGRAGRIHEIGIPSSPGWLQHALATLVAVLAHPTPRIGRASASIQHGGRAGMAAQPGPGSGCGSAPMLPIGIPSLALISAYDTGGSAVEQDDQLPVAGG